MINRILNNWTWTRGAYTIIGLLVLAQAITEVQWWGVALGAYVFLMGLFSFGCAGGNCAINNSSVKPDTDQENIEKR